MTGSRREEIFRALLNAAIDAHVSDAPAMIKEEVAAVAIRLGEARRAGGITDALLARAHAALSLWTGYLRSIGEGDRG